MLASFAGVAAACPACEGYYDTRFAADGALALPGTLDDGSTPAIVLMRGDGRILVAGTCAPDVPAGQGNACISALRSDGTLATDFGTGGSGHVDLGSLGLHNTVVEAAAIDSAGRLWLAVRQDGYHHYIEVMRADGSGIEHGSLDFGAGFAAESRVLHVVAIALRPDGSVLVGGTGSAAADQDPSAAMVVLRLPPGLAAVDGGFGQAGRAEVDFNVDSDGIADYAMMTSMAVQSDGGIVLAGSASIATSRDSLGALARLTGSGDLDTGFGTGGRLLSTFGEGMQVVHAMIVDRKDRILIGGSTELYADNGYGNEFVVNRLLADGAQDPQFGAFDPYDPPGPVVFGADRGGSNDDWLRALALQPDGKIVAVGYGSMLVGASLATGFEAVRLFGHDGQPDWDFGIDASSMGLYSCADNQIADIATGVAISGGIVLAGTCSWAGGGGTTNHGYAAARLFVDEIFPSGFDD